MSSTSVLSQSMASPSMSSPSMPSPTLLFVPPESYYEQPTPWQNHRSSILGVAIAALSLSALCVIGRLYTRLRIVRSPGWDDLFVGLYLLTTAGICTAVCVAPTYGLGEHLPPLESGKTQVFLMLFYISNACYISSTTFIKLSLLFQYIRIYERGTAIRLSCIFLIVTIGLWGAAFAFMAWVPCFPVSSYWDFNPDGKCYGFGVSLQRDTFVAHTGINMVFDILVLALPIPLYFDGTLPAKTRVGMCVLFLLGCLTNVFAAWRLVILVQSQGDPAQIFDATWYAPVTMLLCISEVTLASVCASIPIFWPVLSYSLNAIFVTKEVEVTTGDRYGGGSRQDSETELTLYQSSKTNYNDAFILDQVDPLRYGLAAGTETKIRSDSALDKKKKKIPNVDKEV